jgi:DNA recombination protein RmuC
MATTVLWAVLGALIGAGGATVFLVRVHRRAADNVRQAAESLDRQQRDLLESVKTAFAALSRDALSANADDFLKLANARLEKQTAQGELSLDAKRKLIDARLEEMGGKLAALNTLMQNLDKQRAESFGSLKTQLEKATQVTNRLQDTTAQLREALASPQRRGQWGERMADDVLRLAGFVEGVNYEKQRALSGGNRPDFTFTLPGRRLVHMDVKFPLDNYLKMLEAGDDQNRAALQSQFLRDVRSRVKEVSTRDYIDPASGTVDYMIVFIPNEQVYGFIHQHDRTLLDDAMRSKVVLCSPLTLYAVLSVMRQAVENFRLEQSAKHVLALLEDFRKQWSKYTEVMEKMGGKLDGAMDAYRELVGTRTRQLERQLDRIDDLRQTRMEAAPALSSDGSE